MMGPDNALYVSTSNSNRDLSDWDRILRISPRVAPEFPDDIDTAIDVPENTDTATAIATITADDLNHQTLTYTLSGDGAASFSIDSSTGQLWANAALGYEVKTSYEVTVTATDPNDMTDSVTITITVTDVNEPPSTPAAPTVTATTGRRPAWM